MFELTREENESLRSQNVTLNRGQHVKYMPYTFTEHGILMLSNVLKSDRAVQMSIRIIKIFIRLRKMFADQTEVWLAIERLKGKADNQEKNMEIIFRYLDELSDRIPVMPKSDPRRRIGYKPDE